MNRALAVLTIALVVATSGCTTYDLAHAPTKSLGVGHVHERLPFAAKVATFRDGTQDRLLPPALLARATESFALTLARTELFERVVSGGGERAEIGLEAEITAFHCTRNYGFVWCFYSFLAVLAIPLNFPLSIDDVEYDVALRAVEPGSGKLVGRYQGRFAARSWRGAWSLFETVLDEPGQVLDKANHELVRGLVDDYAKLRAAGLREAARPAGDADPLGPR